MTLTSKLSVAVLALSLCTPIFAGDCCEGDKKETVVAATPQECFKAAFCALMSGDKDGVWAQLSKKSQEVVEAKGAEAKEGLSKCEETQKKCGVTAEQVKEMSNRDVFLTMMIADVKAMAAGEKEGCEGKSECGEKKEEVKAEDCCELKDVKIDGDKATATCPKGMPLAFVKEGDAWKFDLATMMESCGSCGEKEGCEEKAKE